MNAYSIKIECEEDGFHIIIDGDSIDPEYQAGEYGWRIEDSALEAFYDQVKARIGPYLREMHEARDAVARGVTLREFVCAPADVDESGGYDLSDPKHPDFHSVHADIYDNREGK